MVVLGLPEEEALETSVQKELVGWFGPVVREWQHLRTDRIERALPEQLPESDRGVRSKGFQKHQEIWICGDHLSSASIEGAVISGNNGARTLLSACALTNENF